MLIGPNGTGKSNLIDVLRFVDSFAWKGNELGQEVDARGGWSELTWGGRRDSELEVGVGFEHEAAYSVTIRTLVDGGIGADAEGATALGPLRGDEDIRELVEELGAGEAWYAGYEGQSDKDTLPILIRKIGYQGAVRCRVVDRGSMFSAERMEPYVRSLLKQHSRPEAHSGSYRWRRVHPGSVTATSGATAATPRPCRYGRGPIRDCRPRSRRLACLRRKSSAAVLGPRARVNVRGNPEHDPQPAEILRRIFRDNGRKFITTRHHPQIAEQATPSIIARRSPTFTAFMKSVRAATRHRS